MANTYGFTINVDGNSVEEMEISGHSLDFWFVVKLFMNTVKQCSK